MSEDRTQELPGGDMKQVLALLTSMNARLESMDARLPTLEEKVDRRLQDTRPIWEQVLSRLTDIETRLTNVETRLDSIEKRLEKVESEVYDLGRKFRVFNADILKLQDKQEDFDERLQQIESERTK
jgi:DNA repair ATPase RecN